jgi:hypothetical protein
MNRPRRVLPIRAAMLVPGIGNAGRIAPDGIPHEELEK